MGMDETRLALDEFVEVVSRLIIEHHHRRAAELDLTLAQAQILRILRRAPLSTGKLAVELRVSAPAVTQLTDRLTRKSLIDRKPVEGDRRMVLLSLTVSGKALVDGFRRHRNDVFGEAMGHLNQRDRTEVVEALKKISWALGAATSTKADEPSVAAEAPDRPAEASNVTAGAKPVPVAKRIRMEWD
ncbi:MAG: MarR family transcriptional regulator [Acidobacteriota bacterium]